MSGPWRLIGWATVAVGAATLLYFFPLFHVMSLRDAHQVKTFEPSAWVDRFWTDELVPAAAQATNANELIASIRENPQTARDQYGRRAGLGGVYYYFVAGTGKVVAVNAAAVVIELSDGTNDGAVSLVTGHVFGNAVRDGTGLLDVNDFPNSQHFNALSSEINRRIEQKVLPTLRNVAVGAPVRFVGCAEVMDEAADLNPLRIVPFMAEVQ